MKKSAKLKRKTIKMIVKNLIVFTILIAVASVGVRSWYNNDEARKADGKGMSGVQISAPEGMEIAVVAPGESIVSDNDPSTTDTTWYKESFTLNESFLDGFVFSEITGDGRTFIKPPITQYSSVAYPNTSASCEWSDSIIRTTPNTEYLSFDLYFRSHGNTSKVQLDEQTYCGPDTPIDSTVTDAWGNALTGWSPETVIGAARVSIIDPAVDPTDPTKTRGYWQKLLWIPAPFLHYDPVTYHDNSQLNTNVTSTSNTLGLVYQGAGNTLLNLHTDGTYNHGYWVNKTTRETVSYGSDATVNVTATNAYRDFKLHKDVDIFSFPSTTTNYYVDGSVVPFYSGHVRVNIWIEGEDPECRSKQLGGAIKAILKFKLVSASS